MTGTSISGSSRQMELYLSLLPGPQREFLKRCALLDSFDGSIVGDLLPDGNVTLDDVVEYPFVYKVRGKTGAYRLREDVRRALMESWWNGQPPDAVPPELAAFVERLAKRFEREGEADPAKVVGLRLFVNQRAALRDWRELYAEADRRFDLLRCRSLIGLLTWPATVSPEVEAVCEEFRAYVDARSLWTDEWYRTDSFLLPETSSDPFESLLVGERGRMLELRGRAGYGKSSHLRWLIARRCVPAVPRIACARVDFDVVDPLAATRDPYLVLLEMADQLDQQLPGDAFGKLVRENIARRAQLYGRGWEEATAIPDRGFSDRAVEKDRSDTAADVLRRFSARLAEMPADQPVVLILDTLEVPLHLPDRIGLPAIQPLVATLADIQRNAPCVRTVLAGRYHLSDALRGLFRDRLDPFELPQFTEEEARRYLAERRGIQEERQLAAVVQAADGVPFSLALLADLIDNDPEISTSTITSYAGAEYAYLVERVVKRIREQPVRWVLRYAAIARRFDYEFVRDVVWPRVREVMSGARNLDDPADDDLPGDGESRARLWAMGDEPPAQDSGAPAAEVPVQQVWDQVKRYASGSSWIRTDEADPNALRLQPEVVRPLRALLRGRDIVPSLHADAVKYFIRRADEELAGSGQRDRAREYLKEAVFHRFQFQGKAASGWWEEQIRTASDPQARYALAEELALGSDYTEPDGRPPYQGDGWLQTLQRARLELCLASAELASIGPVPDLSQLADLTQNERGWFWQTAMSALARLEAFSTSSLPPGRVALARAAVKLGSGADEADVSEVRTALEEAGTTPRERLWIAVLDAERLTGISSPSAASRLTEAKKLAEQVPGERDLRQMLATASIAHHGFWGAYDKALAECVQAETDGLGSSVFLLFEAMVRIESGDYAGALRTAARLRAADRGATGAATLIEAMSLRMEYQFAAAAEKASRAEALAGAPDPSPLNAWMRGRALFIRGESAAAFLEITAARKALADALRVFEDAHDREEAAGCHVREARLLIRELGQLRAAGVALDSASRAAPEGGDAALAALLLRTELNSRLEDPAGVRAALRAAKLASQRAATPAHLSAVAAAGLAFGTRRNRDGYATQLADNLSQVNPPVARLPLLRDIERGPLLGPRSAAAKRIRKQVIPEGGWDHELGQLAPLDRAALRLNAAALAIVLGDGAEAERMLHTALQEFRDGGESPAELRAILRLGRLLRSQDVVAEAGQAAVAAAMTMASDYPLLAAATAIEHVEAARETGTDYWRDPKELCTQAEDLLSRGPPNAESWQGRLAELQAVVNRPDEPMRMSYLQTAAEIYAAVGDVRKAEQVRSRVPGAGTRHGKDGSAVEVLVKLSGKTIKSDVIGWRLPMPRSRSSAADPVQTAVAEWVRSAASTPYPPRLLDLMVNQWQGFTDALGELMCAADVHRRRRRLPSDAMLSIRVYDGALQSLPWELASDLRGKMLAVSFRRTYRAPAQDMPSSRLIRFVQAGLNRAGYELRIDGVSGPATVKALADWEPSSAASADTPYGPELVQQLHQTLLHGAPPRAVIVRAAASEGRRRSFALERRYARAGLEPYRVDDSHASALQAALNAEPPPVVVHIVGGLVATSGAIGIDLLEGSSLYQAAGLFTPTDLDWALRAVSPNWPSPVVVLDVPLPTGQHETAGQLLLRNSFAADLFSLGGARAVVGTGLAGPDDTRIVQDVLVEGLARGDALGDILQQIRQTGPAGSFDRFWSAMAFAATALWTSHAGIRLPTARNA